MSQRPEPRASTAPLVAKQTGGIRRSTIRPIAVLLVASWSLVSPSAREQLPERDQLEIRAAVEVARANQEEVWLTLRAQPDIEAETLEAIANLAEPEVEVLEKGSDLLAAFKERYGDLDARLWEVFTEFNEWARSYLRQSDGHLELLRSPELDDEREVTFPAAPAWERRFKRRIPAGSDVWTEAEALGGSAGRKTLHWLETENREIRDLGSVTAGTEVTFPYASRYVAVRLSSEGLDDLDKALEILGADAAVTAFDVGPLPKLVPQWGAAELASLPAPCARKSTNPAWPFETFAGTGSAVDEYLTRVLRGNDTVRIAILDSGIPRGDNRFPLWQNWREVTGAPGADDDLNHYIDDKVGVNMLTESGFPVDDTENASVFFRSHGTHVAGIVSAHSAPAAIRAALEERVELMIVKVAPPDGQVDTAVVQDAVRYAIDQSADIINMSFAGPARRVFRDEIKGRRNTLFVAAAGNGEDGEGQDVDDPRKPVYPAKLAETLHNVISVAAHDGQHALACFSNFGGASIDLAAPGIEIESTVHGGVTGTASGTSQATPLVTLAAAFVRSQGIRQPWRIKQRIASTVDLDPDLNDKVSSSGVLNFGKAIAVFHDVIKLRDGTLRAGRLIAPQRFPISGTREEIPRSRIGQIKFDYSDVPGARHRLVLFDGRDLDHRTTELNLAAIEFDDGSGPKTLPVAEISDLVPAMIPTSP